MTNRILVKKGAGTPSPDDLEVAELALNTLNGELYTKLSDDSVVLLNDGADDVDLSDYVKEAPEDGKQYARQDAAWAEIQAAGGGNGNPVVISDDPPASPEEGDLWYSSKADDEGLYCWDGEVWFEAGGANGADGENGQNGQDAKQIWSETSPDGDIYYDKANVGIGVTPGSTTGLSLNRDHNLSWQESSGTSLCNAFRQTQTGAFVLTQGYKWSPTAGGFASSQGGEFSRSAVKLGGTIEFYTDPSVDVPEGTDFTPTPRMTIAADGNVNLTSDSAVKLSWDRSGKYSNWIECDGVANDNYMRFAVGNSEAMRIDASGNVGIGTGGPNEQYNQLQVTAGIAGIVIKGDGTGSYAQQSFRTDEGSWAVGMRPETGSSFVVRNSASGLIPMTIDADGGVTLAHPAKIWGRRTSNDRAIQLIGYDEGTDDVSLVATNDWYVRNGSFDATLKVSATGRVDIPGTLYVNGVPKIGHSELITTLATLRNATKDETTLEGLRDSIGNAIGGLIEKFEQEIAAGTMEISE
jgi:hypothetical protein